MTDGRPSPAQYEELGHLLQVEAGVADHRAEDRAPAKEHGAPERAERGGRNRDIVSLLEVAQAEQHAEDHQPDGAAAQILLEAAQYEPALDLFAHATRD